MKLLKGEEMPQAQYLGTMRRQPSNISALARAVKTGVGAFQASKKALYEKGLKEREFGLKERGMGIEEGRLAEAVKGRGLESMRVGIAKEELTHKGKVLQESKRQFDKEVQEKKIEMQAKQLEEGKKHKEKMAKLVETEAIKLRTIKSKLEIEELKLEGEVKKAELTALTGAYKEAMKAKDMPAANTIADAIQTKHGIDIHITQPFTEEETIKERAQVLVEKGLTLPGHTMEETKKIAGSYIAPSAAEGKMPVAAFKALKDIELEDDTIPWWEKVSPGMQKREKEKATRIKTLEKQFKGQYTGRKGTDTLGVR